MRLYLTMAAIALLAAPAHAAPDDDNIATSMLSLVNAARREGGCPPLKLEPRLTAAAQKHARAMAEQNFFAHQDPGGKSAGDRAKAEGYVFTLVGENISAGYTNVEDVMDGWMKSPGHRANILSCAYKDLGVGHVYQADDKPLKGASAPMKHYWVHVFGLEMRR